VIYEVLSDVWRLQVLVALQVIWAWRNSHRSQEAWCRAHALAVYHQRRVSIAFVLRARYDDDLPRLRIIQLFSQLQSTHTPPLAAPMAYSPTDILVFFDGGSRGNPGPSGAGSILVAVSHDRTSAQILWAAAMSYRTPHTNNQAEYLGLINGLKEVRRQRHRYIHVVGDSLLIIQQMNGNRPPRSTRLLPLYTHARQLADLIGVRTWTHQYRTNNKMADWAANLAMDTQRSFQAPIRMFPSTFQPLHALLRNDIHIWQPTAKQPKRHRLAAPTLDTQRQPSVEPSTQLVASIVRLQGTPVAVRQLFVE
jgi:ribonuclease HI